MSGLLREWHIEALRHPCGFLRRGPARPLNQTSQNLVSDRPVRDILRRFALGGVQQNQSTAVVTTLLVRARLFQKEGDASLDGRRLLVVEFLAQMACLAGLAGLDLDADGVHRDVHGTERRPECVALPPSTPPVSPSGSVPAPSTGPGAEPRLLRPPTPTSRTRLRLPGLSSPGAPQRRSWRSLQRPRGGDLPAPRAPCSTARRPHAGHRRRKRLLGATGQRPGRPNRRAPSAWSPCAPSRTGRQQSRMPSSA